jgi:hypothetical protein
MAVCFNTIHPGQIRQADRHHAMNMGDRSMKRTLKQGITGTVLTACISITNAAEAPKILGAVDYQALRRQAMAQIVGQGGGATSGGGIEMGWCTSLSSGASPELQASGGGM